MSNHLHLLGTPARPESLAKVMQSAGRRYVAHFNRAYRRTGTLWEGRHKAGFVKSDFHLMACYRYIELNPVRAGIVASPAAYPWSSHLCNAFGRPDPLVIPHAGYQALADNPESRRCAYRSLFLEAITPQLMRAIRAASNQGWAVGDEGFCRQVQGWTGVRIAPLRRGRRGRAPGSEKVADPNWGKSG